MLNSRSCAGGSAGFESTLRRSRSRPEFVATHDFTPNAKTDWDIVPQFQVTLSQRQHVRVNLGVSIPVTNTADRPIQAVMYVLWDWFDGGLREGWR